MSVHSPSQPLPEIDPASQHLIQDGYPRFLELLQTAEAASRQQKQLVPLLENLETYNDNPMLLYACLWLAYCKGVTVTFLPRERKKSSAKRRS